MQIDNLICLCCLLLLVCYILEAFRFSNINNNIKLKKKKIINTKIKSITNFFRKYRKKKYSLVIPNSNNIPISKKKKLYFRNFLKYLIDKLVVKLNLILKEDFNRFTNINFTIKNYSNIYYLSSLFYLESINYRLKIQLVIIYVSIKEYYIINMDLLDIKQKEISSIFREAKLYNKWIIN